MEIIEHARHFADHPMLPEAVRAILRRARDANDLSTTAGLLVDAIKAAAEAREAAAAFHDAAREALALTMDSLPDGFTAVGEHWQATVVTGRPAVEVEDDRLLPLELLKTTTVPNKAAIAAILKAGQPVPGARFRTPTPSLRIVPREEAP